jgi:hypothetical protein
MSDYNDFGSTGASGSMPSKQEIMDSVRGQLAIANAQELMQVGRADKCLPPGKILNANLA